MKRVRYRRLKYPEYEYLDCTPTTGDVADFLSHLANEAMYLAGDDAPVPQHFSVGIDYWGAGCVRYLIDEDTGARVQ
jgi:hypothetical protein